MPTEPRTSERFARWVVALSAAGAALVAWLSTELYGVGLDGDAAWMLSAGTSFARGAGFATCLDEPYSLWPPLHPALVALFVRIGGDPLPALRVVQVASLVAAIVLAAALARRASGSAFAGAATAVVLASSHRLHEYTVQLVSETLFLPLVLGALLCAATYFESRRNSWLAWAIVLSALASLQRYLGVVAVAVIAAGLAFERGQPWGRRIARAGAYGAASTLPLALWLVRNFATEGKWTGGRTEAKQSFADIAGDALTTLRSWASIETFAPWTGWFALAVAALSIALLAHVERRRPIVLLATALACGYLAFVVVASASVRVDRVGDRLLLPALPVGVALAWAGVARVCAGGWSRAAAVALAALLALDSGLASVRYVRLWRTEGAGSFHTRAWMEHPLTQLLPAAELHEPCYSNAPELVWLVRGARGRMLYPHRKSWQRTLEEIDRSGRAATVVWFQKDGRPPGNFDLFEAGERTRTLAVSDAGRIVVVEPR